MIWFGGLLLSIVAFIFGRVTSQSEVILAEKRRIYEEVLRACPLPSLVYQRERAISELDSIEIHKGPLMLYAAPAVAIALGRYIEKFGAAVAEIDGNLTPLHPAFREAAKAHNDLILEMRRDALSWSAFGYHGKSRIPEDALEQAKQKSLD